MAFTWLYKKSPVNMSCSIDSTEDRRWKVIIIVASWKMKFLFLNE